MKVNAGCGKRILPGYVNVDLQGSPDIVADLRVIPLEDGCASEVFSAHVIEHFFLWEVPDLLREWRRLLAPRGLLVIECPNLEAAARNLLAGMNDQMAMWPIYGDWNHKDALMMHKHGYTPKTLAALLKGNGFDSITHQPPQTHGARANRDMRIEARKMMEIA